MPETTQLGNEVEKFLEVDGFRHVRLNLQLLARQAVFLISGSREDHDRDLGQILVGLDLAQHFTAVLARQSKIEKDEIRTRCFAELACASETQARLRRW